MSALSPLILTIIVLVPTAGAIFCAWLPRRGKVIPWTALIVSLVTFGLTLHLPFHFVYGQPGYQFETNRVWIANPLIHYHVGVDGLSMWLVVLTGLLAPVGVLASWKSVTERTREFYSLLLLQTTAMLGIFVALDLIVYYAFWEMSLVPMALMIGMFGRTRRARGAAIQFFIYTFVPSALLLVAMVWLYTKAGTFDLVELANMRASGALALAPHAAMWASLAFLVAFAVKVPVFPLHGWLPDAISEAPTAMAIVLAGKLGLYSILRFSLALFPAESARVAPWMITLGVISILYGALLAWVQTDLKKLASYATLSALGFCIVGIFAFTSASLDGATYQTLNEGVSGAALFVLLGALYQRYGTYKISAYGGVAAKLPWLTAMMVFACLSLMGLPPLNSFVGEFLVLSGTFGPHRGFAVCATLGVILSAVYLLSMLQRVFYGPPHERVIASNGPDLTASEHFALWPLLVLIAVMGVASPFWMRAIDPVSKKAATSVFTSQFPYAVTDLHVLRNIVEHRIPHQVAR